MTGLNNTPLSEAAADSVPAAGDDVSFLTERIPLEELRRMQERNGFSIEEIAAAVRSLEARGEPLEDPPEDTDPLLSLFKPLEDFPEEEAEWFVPGLIPAEQITLMAADGGIGKTTLWCNVIAARSNGQACILDPPDYTCEPMKIMFMTSEDSIRKKLKKKLRLAGANMKNIIAPDFSGGNSGLQHRLKFGTPELEKVLRFHRPAFCVFDPVQGYIPPRVNMGSRNEMRDCMAQLITLAEDVGTTFLVVCHTNKRKGAFGRYRIADSADLWDIVRSVLMAGFTEDQGVRYLSNEKNNYTELQQTILFTIDEDGQPHREGTTWKRDREFIQDAEQSGNAPRRESCKVFILQTLSEAGGTLPVAELEDRAGAAGYSPTAVKRAKRELTQEGAIRRFQTGDNRDKTWHIQALKEPPGEDTANEQTFMELPDDGPTPFDPARL